MVIYASILTIHTTCSCCGHKDTMSIDMNQVMTEKAVAFCKECGYFTMYEDRYKEFEQTVKLIKFNTYY